MNEKIGVVCRRCGKAPATEQWNECVVCSAEMEVHRQRFRAFAADHSPHHPEYIEAFYEAADALERDQ